MSEIRTWSNDWEAFVRVVCDLYGLGLKDADITQQFAGKPVVWAGEVAEKRVGRRLGIDRPGVQMDMPAVSVDLSDGRHVEVDYLFLTLKEGELPLWKDIETGTTIRFATQIRQASGPFPGIEWTDLDDRRGLVTFLTDGAVPVW